jgi:hypothetical protein
VIKSRTMRMTGNVESKKDKNAYRVEVGISEE